MSSVARGYVVYKRDLSIQSFTKITTDLDDINPVGRLFEKIILDHEYPYHGFRWILAYLFTEDVGRSFYVAEMQNKFWDRLRRAHWTHLGSVCNSIKVAAINQYHKRWVIPEEMITWIMGRERHNYTGPFINDIWQYPQLLSKVQQCYLLNERKARILCRTLFKPRCHFDAVAPASRTLQIETFDKIYPLPETYGFFKRCIRWPNRPLYTSLPLDEPNIWHLDEIGIKWVAHNILGVYPLGWEREILDKQLGDCSIEAYKHWQS